MVVRVKAETPKVIGLDNQEHALEGILEAINRKVDKYTCCFISVYFQNADEKYVHSVEVSPAGLQDFIVRETGTLNGRGKH